ARRGLQGQARLRGQGRDAQLLLQPGSRPRGLPPPNQAPRPRLLRVGRARVPEDRQGGGLITMIDDTYCNCGGYIPEGLFTDAAPHVCRCGTAWAIDWRDEYG